MIRIAIHDPTLLSAAQRERQFLDHQAMFDRLVELHETMPADRVPQHRLLIGPAGAGKTMLLARLRDQLGGVYCTLQEGVGGLDDLWRRVLDAADLAAEESLEPIEQLVQSEHRDQHGRVAVWIDDFDRVLESLGGEAWRLRELLSNRTDLVLCGTARKIPDDLIAYEAPFFDFFALDRLDPLDAQQSLALLHKIAASLDEDRRSLDEAAWTKPLISLLRGNPRALTLCIEASIVQGASLDAATCLAHVCDRSAPEFEQVLASISPLARVILAGLAHHWHPAHAKTIATEIDQPTNTVSTYFDRLSRDRLVEKVELPPGKTNGYQVRDRLFNLWMLCRGPHATRAKVAELLRRAAGEDFDRTVLHAGVPDGADERWLAVELREPE